jgi:hypothetical protein
LKQQGGDHSAYITRFHELSLLVPHQVTPVSRAIKKYIRGLPIEVQTHVLASQPTTLATAIRMAASITDIYVTAGTLTVTKPKKKTNKTKRTKETLTDSEIEDSKPKKPKRKKTNTTHSYAIPKSTSQPNLNTTYTTQTPLNQPQPQFINPQPYRRTYQGHHPKCLHCHYHHPTASPCRLCTSCNRLGHFAEYCRTYPMPLNSIPPTNQGCYTCGNLNHFMGTCPYNQTNTSTTPTLQIDRSHMLAITNGEDQVLVD